MNKNGTLFKSSSVEWLGELPKHWEVLKIKHLAKILRGQFSHRPRNDPKLYNGKFPFIQTGDVANANKFIMEYRQTLNEDGYAVSKEFPSGTLVMTIAANIGDMAILNFNACFPDSVVGFIPSNKTGILFLYYLFSSMRKQFLSTAVLNTQLNLNIERISNLFTVIPPLSEQDNITEYLDRETTQIDNLIAAKEQMLTLLEEKREALISHAVTRGLDPNVAFKRSGLDWLGDIPQHWEVCQLKRIWQSNDYGISENIRGDGEIKVLRMTCIEDGIVDLSKGGEVESVDPYLLLRKGDLLFNRTNSLDQVAKVGIVQSDPEQPTTFASYLVRIRTNDLAYPEFLAAYLNSQDFLAFARKNAIAAIGQANLSPSRYGEIKIAIPPKSEQEKIVDIINKEREKNRELGNALTDSIALLKERRSALITAAVTGQISLEEMTS